MYDPNFQQKGHEQGVASQEGKLNMIRVKRLKFTLKGSNYEDAQTTALGGEERCYGNFPKYHTCYLYFCCSRLSRGSIYVDVPWYKQCCRFA